MQATAAAHGVCSRSPQLSQTGVWGGVAGTTNLDGLRLRVKSLCKGLEPQLGLRSGGLELVIVSFKLDDFGFEC